MNIKKYILLFFILLSTMVFGQRGDVGYFSFKVKFEKDIPVEKIEVFYLKDIRNIFNKINYRVNVSDNEFEIFGTNSFVVGQHLFSKILFSYKEEKLFKYDYDLTEKEVQNLFYLIGEFDTFPSNDSLKKEIKFSKEYPNIIISNKNENGIIWDVSKISTQTYYKMPISNELVKIKPVE